VDDPITVEVDGGIAVCGEVQDEAIAAIKMAKMPVVVINLFIFFSVRNKYPNQIYENNKIVLHNTVIINGPSIKKIGDALNPSSKFKVLESK
jgi:hypothetical protein